MITYYCLNLECFPKTCVEGLVATLGCNWEAAEPLGGETSWEEVRLLRVWSRQVTSALMYWVAPSQVTRPTMD